MLRDKHHQLPSDGPGLVALVASPGRFYVHLQCISTIRRPAWKAVSPNQYVSALHSRYDHLD